MKATFVLFCVCVHACLCATSVHLSLGASDQLNAKDADMEKVLLPHEVLVKQRLISTSLPQRCLCYVIIVCCLSFEWQTWKSCSSSTYLWNFKTINHYFLFHFHLLQSMSLYWATSATYSTCQNILLKLPSTRALLRMPSTAYDSDTPLRDIKEGFKAKYFNRTTKDDENSVIELGEDTVEQVRGQEKVKQ